jgi:outer membrane protein assembly factor BamA
LRYFFIPLLLILIANNAFSQGTELVIQPDSVLTANKISYKQKHANLAGAVKESKRIIQSLYSEGYLEASIDSTKNENGKHIVYLHTGAVYHWGIIRQGNAEGEMLSETGLREKILFGKKLRPDDISKIASRVTGYYENHGYPFATFTLDSITIIGGQIEASMKIDKNKLYKIDSIIVKGDAMISESYLYNYISIKPGDPYNESLLRRTDTRLKEIPFVELARGSEIIFTEKQATLVVYLRKKKASQFNGILGILPDNKTGKIVVTGDARIRLRNSFGKGELIDLNWRKLYNSVQDLKVNFNYPFMFKTSFGTDLTLKIYKKDTTFLEVQRYAALQYHLKGGNFFKLFIASNSTDLLTPSMFSSATVLPEFGDVSTFLYGTGIHSEYLDYKLNPRRGISIEMNVSAGTKKIRKNSALPETIYDNVKLQTSQYQLVSRADFFIPLFARSTIKIGNQTAFIINEQLFQNEMFRIGGIHTLRGFDEESIPASFYSIGTAEYRFLPEANSSLFLFLDWCYYEKKTHDTYSSDTPYGFGAGASFQTKAGIFSISYALGSQEGNPILLRAAKVHFGFINYF